MNIPDIITTPIIPITNDIFWEDTKLKIKNLEKKSVLVCTTPFTAGSEEESLLLKILEACKLSKNDYNILQLEHNEKIAWHLLRDELGVKHLVLFGIEVEQLGVTVQLMQHQTNRFNNCNWIPTATLSAIIKQPEIKAHLWNYGLKPVFIEKIYG